MNGGNFAITLKRCQMVQSIQVGQTHVYPTHDWPECKQNMLEAVAVIIISLNWWFWIIDFQKQLLLCNQFYSINCYWCNQDLIFCHSGLWSHVSYNLFWYIRSCLYFTFLFRLSNFTNRMHTPLYPSILPVCVVAGCSTTTTIIPPLN